MIFGAVAEEIGAFGQTPAKVLVIPLGAATNVPHEGIRGAISAMLVP